MLVKLERHQGNPILSAYKSHAWEAKAAFNPTVLHEDSKSRLLYRAVSNDFNTLASGQKIYKSSIGYGESDDGIRFIRRSKPLIEPEYSWEEFGCEDPRITRIGDTYYIFYTAVSKGQETDLNVRIAAATTKDLSTTKKLGIIDLSGRSKAAALFPENILSCLRSMQILQNLQYFMFNWRV